MRARIVLTSLFVLASAAAYGADVDMGGITLKLPPPPGQCELDPGQAADKRVIGLVTQATAGVGNDLLGISADCNELTDWRSGKRPLLAHMAQYQTQKARRAEAFATTDANAACASLRAEGERINAEALTSSKSAISKATKDIEFQDQSFIGVLADEPTGCFVGLLQKLKADNGTNVVQMNVFYLGAIKERLIFFYMLAPYEGDATAPALLAQQQAQVAAVKKANGM